MLCKLKQIFASLLLAGFIGQAAIAETLSADDLAFAFGEAEAGITSATTPDIAGLADIGFTLDPELAFLSEQEMIETEGEMLPFAFIAGRLVYSGYRAYRSYRTIRSVYNTGRITSRYTRNLPDGRVRQYDRFRAARTRGQTIGSRYVREYNPRTGRSRSWNENYYSNGNVRHVRVQNNGGKNYYWFGRDRSYLGTWRR